MVHHQHVSFCYMELGLRKTIQLETGRRQNNRRREQHVLQQLFWECTLRCNLKCLHCGSDCKAVNGLQDMPLDDFLCVLDQLKDIANPNNILVVTTGGEPLMRKDIDICGREISKRGYIWGMVSNGMLLTDEKLRNLIDCGLQTIAISLDGFENEHNWMRGNSQSFSKAVNALKALSKSPITWDVITCVNKKNIGHLGAFKRFLLDIGVRQWRIFTVFPSGRAKDNDALQLNPSQMKWLMDFIVRVRKSGEILLNYSCEGFLGMFENEVRDYQFFCQAGINVASIRNDGSISGCLSIRSNYNQGNIYKDDFNEVWLNKFQVYRDHNWMKTGECADCDMWRYCEGNGFHLRDEKGELMLCNLKRLGV